MTVFYSIFSASYCLPSVFERNPIMFSSPISCYLPSDGNLDNPWESCKKIYNQHDKVRAEQAHDTTLTLSVSTSCFTVISTLSNVDDMLFVQRVLLLARRRFGLFA